MSFLARVLEPPTYGFVREGKFYKPTKPELWREFFKRLNFIQDRRNWLTAWGWFTTLILAAPLYLFFAHYFSFKLLVLGFVYSMVVLGTYGTVWLHRYGTHRGYTLKNQVWAFFVRNIVIKLVPEETYIISHHVHHKFSEKPGDPYNVNGGWLYCFLADAIHQPIARNLSETDYQRVAGLIEHTGVHANSYAQYLKWGSICHPAWTILHYVLNWSFWFGALYLLGGMPLAIAIFGLSGVWAVGIRTYNYDGHGQGVDRRREGIDFNWEDLSVNQVWPGYVAGEWHNNHHLYPNGARSGFLPYQLDLAWEFVRVVNLLGGIASYRDYKEDFLKNHYAPYILKKKTELELAEAQEALANAES